MRTLLLALNAKYIHSNIAVRYLQKYAAPFLRQPPQILELTINNRLDFILDEIFRRSPDILLFSTYIWNVDMVRRLASEYRKLRPDALIGAGGPEVSYESEAFLRQNPAFGLIIRGEGEQTVRQLLSAAESGARLACSARTDRADRAFRPCQSPAACVGSVRSSLSL